MKTAMELALARIELMKDINHDSIHWEMFKNDCIEKEKEQIKNAYHKGGYLLTKKPYSEFVEEVEEYYNQNYNQNKYDRQKSIS